MRSNLRIKIVDNSHLHKGHKFFLRKIHLRLKIKSIYLQSMTRVNAQRLIMKVLKEELKTKIHALNFD